jgi:hypothetical protein
MVVCAGPGSAAQRAGGNVGRAEPSVCMAIRRGHEMMLAHGYDRLARRSAKQRSAAERLVTGQVESSASIG